VIADASPNSHEAQLIERTRTRQIASRRRSDEDRGQCAAAAVVPAVWNHDPLADGSESAREGIVPDGSKIGWDVGIFYFDVVPSASGFG
jgi:hypothetical protein